MDGVSVTDAILSATFTASGVLTAGVAFAWSVRALRRRDQEIERRQIMAVRILLRLEIDRNLELLRDFWREAESRFPGHHYLAVGLQDTPLPQLSHARWENHMAQSLLPAALSAEEIRAIYELYSRLDTIVAIWNRLLALPPLGLDASERARVCATLIEETLREGNPLGPPMPASEGKPGYEWPEHDPSRAQPAVGYPGPEWLGSGVYASQPPGSDRRPAQPETKDQTPQIPTDEPVREWLDPADSFPQPPFPMNDGETAVG
jgi:hypothetical protein